VSVLDFLVDDLDALEKQGLRRRLRRIEGPQGAEVSIAGRAVVSFSSNDYLGLAASPALAGAARTALEEQGFGAGASRLISGNLGAHSKLEGALASYHETPVLLFNSGYQANVGVLSALAGPDDVIFSDALNHASLIDGCRLSRARVEVTPHRDLAALERALATVSGRRRFVVTDTIFSMDGDAAPVTALRELCDRERAVLIVDEAHALGVLGPGGRGLCAAHGVRPDVHVGTLGKAFGAFGAYVAGPAALIEVLLNRARSFIFSTALPPSVPAAAAAALEIIRSTDGDVRRAHVLALARRFAAGLRELGVPAPASPAAPILPVVLGDAARTMAACERLLELGIYAQGIRPPTVPRGTARLRFSLTASHQPAHVDRALDALASLRREGLLPTR
jgi:8-amino-7-oxononanoate synthase